MTWTACANTEESDGGRLVVHDGKIVWLWHHDHHSVVYDPAADAWAPLAAEPFTTRVGSVLASVAGSLIVWSGSPKAYRFASADSPVAGGMRLDGTAWREMQAKGAPSARAGAVHVWTGRELVVWGGRKGKPITNGAAYDPATDTWRRLSAKNAATTHNGEYLWSGTELWLWGGAHVSVRTGISKSSAGFAYDPAADAWRALADVPGDKDDLLNARAITRLADAALYVRREDSTGSDDDRCAAWRYDPRADLWEPCTPPPEVRGGEPSFLDCDGRIVLALGAQLFEYLPMRDAWARLPAIPGTPWEPKLVWAAGALHAFDAREGTAHRLVLPDSVEPVAPAVERHARAVPRKRPDVGRGAPVTAVAIASGHVLSGLADGTVRCDERVVRKPDKQRILGLAIHDGAWACLAGGELEVRAWPDGDRASRVELPFSAHTLAHDGDRLVVAGDGGLATLGWAKRKWSVARKAKASGTTSSLALRGEVIARAVLGAPKARGTRGQARDTVEVIDAATLKTTATLVPGVERGTASVLVAEGGVLVAGGGSYDIERHVAGKKRPERIKTDTAWSSPVAASADGTWLLARHAGDGGELIDLRDKHCELLFRPFAGESDEVRAAIDTLHPLPAFLPATDGAALADDVRYRGHVSALAVDGTTVALGTSVGATFVIDRDRLGIDAITASGRRVVWQAARMDVVSRGMPLAIGADVRAGIVSIVRADGVYGELDARAGTWTWGPTLPVQAVKGVRDNGWGWVEVRRYGASIVVTDDRRAVFDHATGKSTAGKAVAADRSRWETRGGKKPLLVNVDPVTGEERGGISLPKEASSAACWVGGDRWFVELEDVGPRVVDTTTGKLAAIEHGDAVGSLDGVHFATPEGREYARRWRIYAGDLATPVRFLELPDTAGQLAVLPGGTIVMSDRNAIGFLDRDNALVWFAGLPGLAGMCPSPDGAFLATWDHHGTVRRWDVARVFR